MPSDHYTISVCYQRSAIVYQACYQCKVQYSITITRIPCAICAPDCDGSGVRTPGNVMCAQNIPGTLTGTLTGTLGVNRYSVISSGLELAYIFSR
jgi:hypothetical protein